MEKKPKVTKKKSFAERISRRGGIEEINLRIIDRSYRSDEQLTHTEIFWPTRSTPRARDSSDSGIEEVPAGRRREKFELKAADTRQRTAGL